ncbi:putative ribosome biogenesis GTPase RsgA [Burkholderiales bacterium]|nr:putative ribosome biogenesis GTPase RsgA [Burkholderiales bacterium]
MPRRPQPPDSSAARAPQARGAAPQRSGDCLDERCAGRVVARFGSRYIVAVDRAAGDTAAGQELDAIGRGRRQDIVVGDRVHCSREQGLLVIEAVEPRRNLLFRADANRTKPLAANVDQIAIVFAAQPPPQPEFVWRALLAAAAAGVEPVAILNKIDLESAAALAALDEVARLGARVVRVSARGNPRGAAQQLEQVCRDRITLFVGQSGVGKSTLLNLLIGSELRTGVLSRRGTHGRQTTTATRWLAYGTRGAVIDSPGFHEFGLGHLSAAELARSMPDFAAVTQPCRFADCHHAEEPDCQVRAAVEDGQISRARYEFYRKLLAQDSGTMAAHSRK